MTASPRRRRSLALALLAALTVAITTVVNPAIATAAPTPPPSNPDGDAPPLLRDVLESTSRRYVEAKAALDRSRKMQLKLAIDLAEVEAKVARLQPEVAEVAVAAYRNGRVGPALMLLNSRSPDTFLARAEQLNIIAARDDNKLRELNQAHDQAARAKAAIDAAAAEERKQLTAMKKEKKAAEKALKLVGGAVTGGYVVANSPVARPAPRGPNGSWPAESCSKKDPTTYGCLTPRTLHALKETQRAGFNRYVACYRPGDMWEHPKGRACDFSAQKSGFGGVATGDDKLYGNNLAAFLVRNAERLGVLYVIWYRQCWMPATGWTAYELAGGDPSSDHTNHVHLSII